MRISMAAILVAVTALLPTAPLVASAQTPEYCRGPHADWVMAQQALREGMEGYRGIKDESIAPKVEQELSGEKGGRGSIARTVQGALRDRRDLMEEAARKIRELLEEEKLAFSRWLRCTSEVRGRPAGPSRSNPESKARDGLIAEINDLMLDEGYVQYRSPSGPAAAPYMGSGNRLGLDSPKGERIVPDRSLGQEADLGSAGRRSYPPPTDRYQRYFR